LLIKSRHGSAAFIFCAAVLLCHVARAQDRRDPVILDHADSLVGGEMNGEAIRQLIGGVTLHQGKTTLRCDRALQWLKSERVDLDGNVVVTNDTIVFMTRSASYDSRLKVASTHARLRFINRGRTITADQGIYRLDERVANFAGSVRLTDSTATVEASRLTYFEGARRFTANGSVVVSNPRERLWVAGEELEHSDSTKVSIMRLLPVMMRIDTAEGGRIDTLLVKSGVMEMLGDSVRQYTASDSVEVVRGAMAARGANLRFDPKRDSLELTGSPVLWYERTEAKGTRVHVLLQQNKVSSVTISGPAIAVSETDTLQPMRRDQLSGTTLHLGFERDSLRTVTATGNAMSISFLFDNVKPNGINRTTADWITLFSDSGSLRTVTAFGGVEGNYYPENMVQGNVEEYRLPGYFWEERRPRIVPPPYLLSAAHPLPAPEAGEARVNR